MLTAVVIFLSKYFSKANEKRNNEKIDINIEGINVNSAKNVIYFLFDFDPLTSISVLIVFFNSKKINIKKNINNNILAISKY